MRPNLVSNCISRCWRVALHRSRRPKPPCIARIMGLKQKLKPCMALCAHEWRPSTSRRSGVQKAAIGARQCVAVWEAADGGEGEVTRVGAATKKYCYSFTVVQTNNARLAHPPRRARCKRRARRAPTAMRHPPHAHACCSTAHCRRRRAASRSPRAALCGACSAHAARRASAAAAAAMPTTARAHGRRSTAPHHCPRRACRGALVPHAVPLLVPPAACGLRPAAHGCERRGAR